MPLKHVEDEFSRCEHKWISRVVKDTRRKKKQIKIHFVRDPSVTPISKIVPKIEKGQRVCSVHFHPPPAGQKGEERRVMSVEELRIFLEYVFSYEQDDIDHLMRSLGQNQTVKLHGKHITEKTPIPNVLMPSSEFKFSQKFCVVNSIHNAFIMIKSQLPQHTYDKIRDVMDLKKAVSIVVRDTRRFVEIKRVRVQNHMMVDYLRKQTSGIFVLNERNHCVNYSAGSDIILDTDNRYNSPPRNIGQFLEETLASQNKISNVYRFKIA